MKRTMEKRMIVNIRNTLNIRNILVCVTQQKTCERLINAAHELVGEYGGKLYVINVVKSELNFLDSARESEALEYLFGISKSVGANLSVLKSDDIPQTIAQYAEENDIGCIIIGKSSSENNSDVFMKKLKSMLKNDIEVKILS